MHGRVKVRTTEEEKARQEKKYQEKVKLLKSAMGKIFDKREKNEMDDEMLEITGTVLYAIPDVNTLWNLRRQVFNSKRNSGGDNGDVSTLFDKELLLTEQCLMRNPKSYSAWYQREWVLMTRDDPNWKDELNLCDKYLKFDERNFHTWDYRRFVAIQCKTSLKDEFDFTTAKLMENFSNYSAWHYRSKLLVQLYPDKKGGRPIKDTFQRQELKLVESAAFTDPDDTSAWFYQRWLISAVKETIQVVVCSVTDKKTTVAFNKCVPKLLLTSKITLYIQNNKVDCDWISCMGYVNDFVWICNPNIQIASGLDVKMQFEIVDGCMQSIDCKEQSPNTYIGVDEICFQKEYPPAVLEELKTQLESCRQLLEMEPDNKWTLLTTTTFLHCIDSKSYHEETIQNLHKLKLIDKLRHGYYEDLISKWCLEDTLTKAYDNNDFSFKLNFKNTLSSIPHIQYLSCCKVVDLSNQLLTSRILPSLKMLQHCEDLNLENNKITSLKLFPKLHIKVLNLKGNDIDPAEIDILKKIAYGKVIF